jgi:hypothetical protein
LLTSKLGGSGGGRAEQAFGALKSIDRLVETVKELRDLGK